MGVTSDKYPVINFETGVGSVCRSTKDGDAVVVSYRSTGDGRKPIIKFIETGNEYEVSKDALRRGIFADREKDRTSEFISKCREVHGDRYSYEKTVFKTVKEKVTITCKEHGDILVNPEIHMKGGNCKRCAAKESAGKLALTKAEFALRVYRLHKGKILAVSSSLKRTANKANFICLKHGLFSASANSILQGIGCRKCGIEKNSKGLINPVEVVKKRFAEVHGDRYIYDWSTYISTNRKMTIICPEHGPWQQAVKHHRMGVGCPSCFGGGFNPSHNGKIYVLRSENMVKIGITNRRVLDRLEEVNADSPELFEEVTHFKTKGSICIAVERKMKRWLNINATQAKEKFDGHTESFYNINVEKVVLQLEKFLEEFTDG